MLLNAKELDVGPEAVLAAAWTRHSSAPSSPACVSQTEQDRPRNWHGCTWAATAGCRVRDYGIIKLVWRVCNARFEKEMRSSSRCSLFLNVQKIAAVTCNSIYPLLGFN